MGETLPKFKYGAPIERKPSTIPQPFNLAPSAPKPLPPPPPEVPVLRSVVDPDPHHFGNPDPHQLKIIIWIRIRIRIRVVWILIRIRSKVMRIHNTGTTVPLRVADPKYFITWAIIGAANISCTVQFPRPLLPFLAMGLHEFHWCNFAAVFRSRIRMFLCLLDQETYGTGNYLYGTRSGSWHQ